MADITVRINGAKVNFSGQQPEFNSEGTRISIPLRGVFDALGYEVLWDGSTQTVTISNGTYTLKFRIGNKKYSIEYLNGWPYNKELDVAPYVSSLGSTMINLRGPLEAVGYVVLWDGKSKTVFTKIKPRQTNVGILPKKPCIYKNHMI